MDHKEILKQAEQSLINGQNKSKSYSELTQVATKYEQIYKDYENEKKKLDELMIRNKDLKSVNEGLMLKILPNVSNPSSQTSEKTNSIESFINGLKI